MKKYVYKSVRKNGSKRFFKVLVKHDLNLERSSVKFEDNMNSVLNSKLKAIKKKEVKLNVNIQFLQKNSF